TVRAPSRGVCFADDQYASAGLTALGLQLCFEHTPAGVQHRFRHPCLDQLQAAHIAYEDILISIDSFSTEFMEGVAPSVRRRAVQAFRLTLVRSPLGLRDLRLD